MLFATFDGGEAHDLDFLHAGDGVGQDHAGDVHDGVQRRAVVAEVAALGEGGFQAGFVQLEEGLDHTLFLAEHLRGLIGLELADVLQERRFHGIHGATVRFHKGQKRQESARIGYGIHLRHGLHLPQLDGQFAVGLFLARGRVPG